MIDAGEIGPVIQIAEKNAAMLALINQVAQPNTERNRDTVQLQDADIPYSTLHSRNERPMQTSLLRQLLLR